jgi:uncharacterized protein with PQ loop repeat
MASASFLGAIGTIIGLIRAVPQLIRLLQGQQAHGVSLDTAATSSIVSFGWAAYGILSAQPYVVFATGSSGLIFAMIAFFAIRFGRSSKEFKVAPFWLGVLLLAGMLAGKNGLGVMLPISVLAANLPQLWVAYRERDLTDLSLGTWALSITDGLVWGIYALIQNDLSIMTYGIFQLITGGVIVLLKLLHLAREKDLNSDTAS